MINAQDKHLKEAEKAGDAAHQPARDEMKGRWKHPKKSLGWYRDMKQAFADLPGGLSASASRGDGRPAARPRHALTARHRATEGQVPTFFASGCDTPIAVQ